MLSGIKNKLDFLRKGLNQEKVKKNHLFDCFKKSLNYILPDFNFEDIPFQIYEKNGKVIVSTDNKSLANELFQRRQQLIERINSEDCKIEEIHIR